MMDHEKPEEKIKNLKQLNMEKRGYQTYWKMKKYKAKEK